jgi:FkbM family methyltransferase
MGDARTHGGETVAAPCVDLVACLRDLGRPVAVVKMDVEGAEVPILERLLDAPERDLIGALFVETHGGMYPRHLVRLVRLRRRVAALGRPFVCLDLGANVGSVTLRLAATGATVHAFEPDPWAFARLSAATEALANVVRHAAAVSDREGAALLHRYRAFARNPARGSAGSSIMGDARTHGGETVAVPCVDLVAFLRDLGRPVALVKMDVEGAEVPILERLLDAPERKLIGALFVETHGGMYPGQLRRLARLRRRAAALERPFVCLDWP